MIDSRSKGLALFLAILAGVSPLHADKVVVKVKVFWNGVPPSPQSMLSGIDVQSSDSSASLNYNTERGIYWAFSDNLLAKLGATDRIAVTIVPHTNQQGVYLDLNDATPVVVQRDSLDQKRTLWCFDQSTYYGELVARAAANLNAIDTKPTNERDERFNLFFENMRRARDVAERQDSQYCIRWTEGICRLVALSAASETNKSHVNEWFDRACRELPIKEGTINLSRVISACSRAKDKNWGAYAVDLLTLAQDNSLTPTYGVGDLWESLQEQKKYQMAYDLAISQVDQISNELDGKQIAWIRRALSALNDIAAGDRSQVSQQMTDNLKQRIELRKSFAGPLELKTLQQMESELSKYSI